MTEIINSIITGLVVSIIGGFLVFVFQKMWSKHDTRIAHITNIRKMYNDILLSWKEDGDIKLNKRFFDALTSLFDYIAILKQRDEIDDEEFKIWRGMLKNYCYTWNAFFTPANINQCQNLYSPSFLKLFDEVWHEVRDEIEKDKKNFNK